MVTSRKKSTLSTSKIAERFSTLWLSENKLCTGTEMQWCIHYWSYFINSLPQKWSRRPRNPPNLHFHQGSALSWSPQQCAAAWDVLKHSPRHPAESDLGEEQLTLKVRRSEIRHPCQLWLQLPKPLKITEINNRGKENVETASRLI